MAIDPKRSSAVYRHHAAVQCIDSRHRAVQCIDSQHRAVECIDSQHSLENNNGSVVVLASRDAGTGGAVGATCPHNLEAVGAPPPNFGLSMSFIFIFVCFCTRTWVSLKNSGPNP